MVDIGKVDERPSLASLHRPKVMLRGQVAQSADPERDDVVGSFAYSFMHFLHEARARKRVVLQHDVMRCVGMKRNSTLQCELVARPWVWRLGGVEREERQCTDRFPDPIV